MVTLHIDASTPYDVSIGQGDDWITRARYFTTSSSIWVITDQTVDQLHGKSFKEQLTHANLPIIWSVVPPGDASKSLTSIERLVKEGLESNCDRKTLVIAFGGGMIGDLAGFLASVYMRGLPYVQVPTTVLAHDSAVGGKVAVNHPMAKNAIGAFYQPIGVHYNVNRLATLTERDVVSGLGELIKHAYLSKYVLGVSFESELFNAVKEGKLNWEYWLARGIEVKKRIVEADEREEGVRAWLNFGHTFGHALESTECYRLAHGEAVLYGMVYAFLLGGDESRARRLADWMKDNQISRVNWQPFDSYLQVMMHDKKNREGKVNFVLLENEVTIQPISKERLASVFLQMKGWF